MLAMFAVGMKNYNFHSKGKAIISHKCCLIDVVWKWEKSGEGEKNESIFRLLLIQQDEITNWNLFSSPQWL